MTGRGLGEGGEARGHVGHCRLGERTGQRFSGRKVDLVKRQPRGHWGHRVGGMTSKLPFWGQGDFGGGTAKGSLGGDGLGGTAALGTNEGWTWSQLFIVKSSFIQHCFDSTMPLYFSFFFPINILCFIHQF